MMGLTIAGRMPLLAVTVAGIATTGIGLAQAASFEVASRIDRVTLFPDAAIVSRTVSLDLPAGNHELTIPDLPQLLDPASLRIEGLGDSKLVIGGIDFRIRPATPKAEADLERQLKTLRLDRDRTLDRIDAVEGRKAMIQRLAQGAGEGKDARPIDIDQFMKVADAVGKGLLAANEELRALRIEEARLDAAIAAIEAAIGQTDRQQPKRVAVLPIEAAAAGKVTLTVSYRVRGATWRPIYDARLDTRGSKPGLDLTRRAMIRQSTGEDWSEVVLTLSTLRVARGTQAPELAGERAQFYERPQPVPLPAPVSRSAPQSPQTMSMAAPEFDGNRRKIEDGIATEEAQAKAEASAFQTEFTVPGRISMPSAGEEKGIRLASDRLEPVLRHRAVPISDATAYLEAAFRWKGDAPLLAGEVLLSRDAAFVGRGRVKDIASGEEVRLGFGADDKVKIMRVPLQREVREPGLLGSTRTDDLRFRIDARNLHAFPVELMIVDRMPVSEDQQITVERLPEMTKPDLETIEDRRGVFAWLASMKPQESRSFVNAYRLRWPAQREIRLAPLPR